MTPEQKSQCHKIIHTNALLAGGGNAAPVPGLGFATDMATMTAMAMSLSVVFGSDIPKNVAKNIAITQLKRQALKQPIKIITKSLAKYIPYAGQVISGTMSVAMVESAGWAMAKQLELEAQTRGRAYA